MRELFDRYNCQRKNTLSLNLFFSFPMFTLRCFHWLCLPGLSFCCECNPGCLLVVAPEPSVYPEFIRKGISESRSSVGGSRWPGHSNPSQDFHPTTAKQLFTVREQPKGWRGVPSSTPLPCSSAGCRDVFHSKSTEPTLPLARSHKSADQGITGGQN